MTLTEIMNNIHEQGLESDVFGLLADWMLSDRYTKVKIIGEYKSTMRAINKIATENKNVKQAIEAVIRLSEEEEA